MRNRKQEILDFIIEYRRINNFSPSLREIGKGVGLYSTSSVQKYIGSLIEQGLLRQTKGKMRSLLPLSCVNGDEGE